MDRQRNVDAKCASHPTLALCDAALQGQQSGNHFHSDVTHVRDIALFFHPLLEHLTGHISPHLAFA